MKIDFPIIAIGASAGGLEPLETFFENADPKSDFAYIIVQHLAPNHKSLMDELLSRHTELPIHVIEEGMAIEKGYIYLNPPKKFIEISNGKFVLSEKEDRKLSFPISSFFSSLAEFHHEKACSIVLSGTGSDGSEGIKFIKEKGGLVLVQNPDSAKFNGMPNNSINTGVVDKICEVESMHKEIDNFFLNKNIIENEYLNSSSGRPLIAKILKSVLNQIDVDFTGYKHTTVSRRISRRMSLLGYHQKEEYHEFLKDNTAEAHLLSKELLIGVTRFFRDEEAFEALKNEVIPKLIKDNMDTRTLRIWIPACSTGEEAYSIAILIKDYLRTHKLQFNVSVFATDLDKESIRFAANRVFSENISAEIPSDLLNTYFISQRSGYTIVKEIREMIIFSVHNIIQDPPFNKIDLISCRNFLIYLNDNTQQKLFLLFQYALKTKGFLFLGSSESLGASSDQYIEFNQKYKIFINKENKKFIQRLHAVGKKNRNYDENSSPDLAVKSPSHFNKSKLLIEIQHSLIQEYVPDSIVIDENFNLLHTTGNANRWLYLPSGEVSTNVLKMMPESISMPIEVVVNKVMHTGKSITLSDIELTEELKNYYSAQKYIKIHIRKKELMEGLVHLFITFEPQINKSDHPESEQISVSAASKDKINLLQRELRVNRETLQTTIEELESSNEELQAANEELQSSNEELESVNEELYTVNAEYEQKNLQLTGANDDLDNLIQSTEIALLFLDSSLNIRKFTPSMTKILELLPLDIGRSISHFRGKIQLEDFLDQVETVLESSIPYEANIKDVKEREYLLKITPFTTKKNEVQGIVLVFIDLTQANSLRKSIEVSDRALLDLKLKHDHQSEIFELISNNLRDMIFIANKDMAIEYCSPSGADVTGYPLEEIYSLNFLDRIPELEHVNLWKRAIAGSQNNQEHGLIQFKFKTHQGKIRWLEANLKPLNATESKNTKILITVRDIHERMLREIEFQRMSLIAEQTSSAVIITDTSGKISFMNESFEKMTGFTEAEALGKVPGQFLQGEESDPGLVRLMSVSIKKRRNFEVDIINYTKLGHKYLVKIQAEPLYDRDNKFIGYFSIQNDITNQKDHIDQIHKLNKKIKEQFQKLEEVNKSLEDFAFVASHDLKAPVRNINGLLEIIKKKGDTFDSKKRDEYFDIIIASSNELNRLIDNLLEYSRTGVLNEELEEVHLSEIIEKTVDQFNAELDASKAEITFDLDVTYLHVYPILFKRLFTNLISNALKYRSEEDPLIRISCKKNSDYFLFEVSDNGIGIPDNQRENIFKIFNTLVKSEDSNGIGLAVCKKIVELHGGQIWVEPNERKGTKIIFKIAKLT